MSVRLNQILSGTVVGIGKYEAFIKLDTGEEGSVHISEISEDYVVKIEDRLSKGDKVKVKVIEINPEGKIFLSMKKVEDLSKNRDLSWEDERHIQKDLSFEDKLSRFMKRSNENIQQIRTRENKRSGNTKK